MDKKSIFEAIDKHLVKDEKPSAYLTELLEKGLLEEFPLSMLKDLVKVEQSPEHHPEGNVWNHTMLVIDNAALRREQSKDKRVFMWAALLHDIGKTPTTRLRKGRITSYDHDKEGEKMATAFLKDFDCEEIFINEVAQLVRWHMHILFVVKNLPFAEIKKMKSLVSIEEVALLGLCDRLGRKGHVDEVKEQENIRVFLEKCKNT